MLCIGRCSFFPGLLAGCDQGLGDGEILRGGEFQVSALALGQAHPVSGGLTTEASSVNSARYSVS